ncbi:unnamed protein product [Clonostachys rosea f. rosea IK726]|uniref:Uncharacterized protein n=1 Tax=Clonostachys rosea f. rosea IK726 TaxID=1349383 RepID=A0ACA9U9D1_BIOOC|nr:unnamed protein product [Clonostachys rosea f. rosea IK726]
MRNIQVPAYCPVVVGAQALENSGVLMESKNVIVISAMDIIMLSSLSPMLMDEVEVAAGMSMLIDMPAAVVVAMFIMIDTPTSREKERTAMTEL